MQRGGRLNDMCLLSLFFPDYLSYHSSTMKPRADEEPKSPLLYRTMSEATLVRKRMKTPMMDRKDRQKHRASINGHFYNHEVSYNSIGVI